MRSRRPPLPSVAVLAALTFAGATPAAAQGGTLAGKSVQMIIGFGPGGGYDLWGRTVGRHIGRHLPGNPTVIPQNMPGAGSYVAASYIFNIAPKDGTVLGIIARDAALGPLSGATGARFDPTRLSWIGTPTKETNVCIAYHTAQVKSVADLFEKQLIVGDTGPGTGTRSYPKALNELIGTKFKLVGGFPASSDVFLAMERGEVEGICESLDSIRIRRPDWIPTKKISILFQGGAEPNPELTDVPFVLDLARTADREAGDRIPLCRPGDRAPVRRAAGSAAGSAEDAARCLQCDHAGCGLRCRSQELETRPRAGGRRASRRADQENLRDAQADRG